MFDILLFLWATVCGIIFGTLIEKKHYRSIIEREQRFKNIIILSDKDLQQAGKVEQWGVLITGGTAISIDAFKKLMAYFVNLFGGRVKSYESLIDRARREAVLRLKEQADNAEYNAIVNLRIETSSITKNAQQNVGSVEALAYGTAVKIDTSWK